MKEDVRFREIEPEAFVFDYPTPKEASVDAEIEGETEVWFDWAFLDFWKSNYCNLFPLLTVTFRINRSVYF